MKAYADRHIGVINTTLDDLGGQIVDKLDGSVQLVGRKWGYQIAGTQIYPAESQDDALVQYVMGNVMNGRIRVADPIGFRNRLVANLVGTPMPDGETFLALRQAEEAIDQQVRAAQGADAEWRLLQAQGPHGGP